MTQEGQEMETLGENVQAEQPQPAGDVDRKLIAEAPRAEGEPTLARHQTPEQRERFWQDVGPMGTEDGGPSAPERDEAALQRIRASAQVTESFAAAGLQPPTAAQIEFETMMFGNRAADCAADRADRTAPATQMLAQQYGARQEAEQIERRVDAAGFMVEQDEIIAPSAQCKSGVLYIQDEVGTLEQIGDALTVQGSIVKPCLTKWQDTQGGAWVCAKHEGHAGVHVGTEEQAEVAALEFVDVVFDGPPGAESGRFVECEDPQGRGIRAGEWIDRVNGFCALRIPLRTAPAHTCGTSGEPELRVEREARLLYAYSDEELLKAEHTLSAICAGEQYLPPCPEVGELGLGDTQRCLEFFLECVVEARKARRLLPRLGAAVMTNPHGIEQSVVDDAMGVVGEDYLRELQESPTTACDRCLGTGRLVDVDGGATDIACPSGCRAPVQDTPQHLDMQDGAGIRWQGPGWSIDFAADGAVVRVHGSGPQPYAGGGDQSAECRGADAPIASAPVEPPAGAPSSAPAGELELLRSLEEEVRASVELSNYMLSGPVVDDLLAKLDAHRAMLVECRHCGDLCNPEMIGAPVRLEVCAHCATINDADGLRDALEGAREELRVACVRATNAETARERQMQQRDQALQERDAALAVSAARARELDAANDARKVQGDAIRELQVQLDHANASRRAATLRASAGTFDAAAVLHMLDVLTSDVAQASVKPDFMPDVRATLEALAKVLDDAHGWAQWARLKLPRGMGGLRS